MGRMKVLVVDPWGIEGTAKYLNGLVYGISKEADVTLATNYFFEQTTSGPIRIERPFFKFSEKMKKNRYRKIIRGLEYIWGYIRIVFLVKKENYDVIHINWFLNYSVDICFLKVLKQYCRKIVYTAHNVVPHIKGIKQVGKLKIIYELVDVIILHGKKIKDEFSEYFPLYTKKVYFQHHGADLYVNTFYEIDNISTDIQEKIDEYRKIFFFNGNIFYNKGIDRVLDMWNKVPQDCLLVIAGKITEKYPELVESLNKNASLSNVIYFDKYINEDLLAFFMSHCHVVLLPYRHASMSGVVFTAADYSKPVLATKVGAIPEYLIDGDDSFLVENDDLKLTELIQKISNDISINTLEKMGNRLHENISSKYSWDKIGAKLVSEVYCEF